MSVQPLTSNLNQTFKEIHDKHKGVFNELVQKAILKITSISANSKTTLYVYKICDENGKVSLEMLEAVLTFFRNNPDLIKSGLKKK